MIQDAVRIALIAGFMLIAATVQAIAAGDSLKAVILISKDIKPYLEAAEGIQKVFDKNKIEAEIVSLEKSNVYEDLSDKIIRKEIAVIIAIGPEALALAETQYANAKIPVIYALTLNPEKIVKNLKSFCGIPFAVPVNLQLQYIAKSLPGVKKLGLLYDPAYNDSFFKQASEIADNYNIKLMALNVSSSKEISLILKENWNKIDGLWLIPDRTIISESVIQYIIKEAVLKKIPVIGYNRFFYESGAAASFVFDYEELGEQTAKLAIESLSKKGCSDAVPIFHVWLNSRVIMKLGIEQMADNPVFPIEIKP